MMGEQLRVIITAGRGRERGVRARWARGARARDDGDGGAGEDEGCVGGEEEEGRGAAAGADAPVDGRAISRGGGG